MASSLARCVLFSFLAFGFCLDAYAQVTTPVTPGALRAYSTIYSIGLEWDIVNDSDHDAATAVDYRVAGTTAWTRALPLVRVDDGTVNRVAGSVMLLEPDTEYEVRAALTDPDGGGETRTVIVRTRRVPIPPVGGRTFHVVPGSAGGSGTIEDPFRGIGTAESVAQPGDTFLLHAGGYGGRIRFSRPGASTSYIAWKAAGDGEVLIDGIDVAASHLWLEGLTMRGRAQAMLSVNSPTNVVVTRCRFLNNQYAIWLTGAGTNWYIVDNTIVGDSPPASGSFEGEGVALNTTSGHTVAYNSITNVADAVSDPFVNVDIFANDIFDTSDDGIEADTGGANVRMWGNRIHNAVHNGISFQPQSGAPWYIIRNQIVSNVEAAFKFRQTDRFVLLHNTIVNWGNAWPGTSMMCCNEGHLLRAFARNNLWISILGGQIWGFDADLRDWRTDLDYDGFDWGDAGNPFEYAGVTHPDLLSFSTASGMETRGIRVRRDTCFETFDVPAPSPATVPPQVMTLRADCEAVDAGAVLPNVNDAFSGAGPDLGAHEHGAAAARYGPRPRTDIPPAAPSFLRGTASTSRVDLQWTDNSTNEAGFVIERSSGGQSFAAIARVNGDSPAYSDSAVAANTSYSYRVAAYNEAGISSLSNVISVTTSDTNAPPAVQVTTPVNGATFTAPATIGIAADASDSDGSVVSVEFRANGNLIATRTAEPWSTTWSGVADGTYTITARATDDRGAATTSAGVTVTVTAQQALPPGWQSLDIGAVGPAGSASESDGTFTVRGAGADVWGTADAFHYAYRTLSGDGTIVARVASVEGTDPWTKMGVMIRATTSPGSQHAFMLVSTGKGLAFQRRTVAGGTSTHTSGGPGTAPRWVRLQRAANLIIASVSTTGSSWTEVGRETIAMPQDVLVGLAATSHTTTTLATGRFDNVSITQPAPPLPAGWQSRDIGAVGPAGSATESEGTFTVRGAGADVWGTADAFHYAYRTLTGDGTIVARVASIAGTDVWTKVGVMIRATTSPGSQHAFMLVSTGKGLAFQRRTVAGGTSTHTSGGTGTAPRWVRLQRAGSLIIASVSTTGTSWTEVGRETISMPQQVLVGLAVTSHTTASLATGTFDNVTVTTVP